jgi:histidinol phosphatase-like enzyme
VHPQKAKQFESYAKTALKDYCWVFKSTELVKKNFFGLGKPNKKLLDRIGDYVLIMKKNYIIRDSMLDLEQAKFIGNHGGVSHEEMFVPLIVIER